MLAEGGTMNKRPDAFPIGFGWAWQPEDSEATIYIQRTATLDGRAVLSIWTEAPGLKSEHAPKVEITVSKKGRVIRTYPVRGNCGQGDC